MFKKFNTGKIPSLNINVLLRSLSILIAGIIVSATIFFGSDGWDRISDSGDDKQASSCTGDARLSAECYEKYAEELDLNMREFRPCVEEVKHNDVIDRELAAGEATGVQGTPSLYIGKGSGEEFQGFYMGMAGYEEIEDLVNYLKENDVETTRQYWIDTLLSQLDSYREQIRAYYQSAEGGSLSGAELDQAVAETIAQQTEQVQTEFVLADLSVGDGQVTGDGEIVLMEFSDYECPYCQSFAGEVLTQVKTNLVDNGQLRYIFRDFPLENIHPEARPAANAARCAGDQGKYFEYHNLLFEIN